MWSYHVRGGWLVMLKQGLILPSTILLTSLSLDRQQSNKLLSSTMVCKRQVKVFANDQIAHADIPQHLLNIYGDDAVDASTVRKQVVHLRSWGKVCTVLLLLLSSHLTQSAATQLTHLC